MENPRPLQVSTNECIIFAHTGAGVIRVLKGQCYEIFYPFLGQNLYQGPPYEQANLSFSRRYLQKTSVGVVVVD